MANYELFMVRVYKLVRSGGFKGIASGILHSKGARQTKK
jgi:hypothetical protein